MTHILTRVSRSTLISILFLVATAGTDGAPYPSYGATRDGQCYRCHQADGLHRFDLADECTPEEAFCMQCNDTEPGNECHATWESGACNVHLPCAMTLMTFRDLVGLNVPHVARIEGLAERNRQVAQFHAAHKALEVRNCASTPTALTLLEDALAGGVR